MDPNSAHQQWSEWIFTVDVPGAAQPRFEDVTLPLGRFFTSLFGSCGRMKIDQTLVPLRRLSRWTVTVQAEGESVYQPGWRAHVLQAFRLAAERRFGRRVTVQMDVRLLAGQTATATPASQWLIVPTIDDETLTLFGGRASPAQALGVPAVPAATRMW